MVQNRERGFTLIELLIVVAIIGIIAAIAIPNLLNAADRAKQKKTMMDIRSIGMAVELYQLDQNIYPPTTVIGDLATSLETSGYIKKMPTADGWNNPLQLAGSAQEYTICSGGKDGGACTSDNSGIITDFNASVVWGSGAFVQWPEGLQN